MFRFFSALKEEGEDALRRTVWLGCAALLVLMAVAFAAVAGAIALSHSMPMPLALLITGAGVLAAGVVCLALADRHSGAVSTPAAAETSAHSPFNLLSSGIIDRTTQAMLYKKVQNHPASVLAIAAAAGLALAALEMFDDA